MRELLYHYTSATALHSILRDEVMRATDIRYMNDSAELSFGVPIVLSAFAARRVELEVEWQRGDESDRTAKADSFERLCDVVARAPAIEPPTYVCCFSTKPDVLSQWRAYAPGGGYAIGFDPDVVGNLSARFLVGDRDWPHASEVAPFGGYSGTVERVVYGKRASAKLAQTSAERLLATLGPPEASRDLVLTNDAVRHLAQMKNEAFEEEDEQRLILQQEHETPTGSPPLDFQIANQLLKPYIALKFVRADAIRDIWVGPGPDADRRLASVKTLIRMCRLDLEPHQSGATLV